MDEIQERAKTLRRTRRKAAAEEVEKKKDAVPVSAAGGGSTFHRVLFASTPMAVAQSSGYTPDAVGTRYTVAADDEYETVTPPGCTTPTSRLVWRKGHHVPTALYEQRMKARRS